MQARASNGICHVVVEHQCIDQRLNHSCNDTGAIGCSSNDTLGTWLIFVIYYCWHHARERPFPWSKSISLER